MDKYKPYVIIDTENNDVWIAIKDKLESIGVQIDVFDNLQISGLCPTESFDRICQILLNSVQANEASFFITAGVLIAEQENQLEKRTENNQNGFENIIKWLREKD